LNYGIGVFQSGKAGKLFSVQLPQRMGRREARMSLATLLHPADLGEVFKADLEAAGIEELGDQDAIGQRGRRAKAEIVSRQERFHGIETAAQHPVFHPSVDGVLWLGQGPLEILKDAKIVEWVNFAGDNLGNRTHLGGT
jgi:hypothetical protein